MSFKSRSAVCNCCRIIAKLKGSEKISRLTDCRLESEAGHPFLIYRSAIAGGVKHADIFVKLNSRWLTEAEHLAVHIHFINPELFASVIIEERVAGILKCSFNINSTVCVIYLADEIVSAVRIVIIAVFNRRSVNYSFLKAGDGC